MHLYTQFVYGKITTKIFIEKSLLGLGVHQTKDNLIDISLKMFKFKKKKNVHQYFTEKIFQTNLNNVINVIILYLNPTKAILMNFIENNSLLLLKTIYLISKDKDWKTIL